MSSPFLVAMIGLTALKTCSIPFLRPKRHDGKTAYTPFMRLKIGVKTVLQLLQIKSKIAHAQKQQDYYSQADHYNIFPENHPVSIQRHLQHFCKHLPLTSDEKVLEVGCGMELFTIPLAQKGLQIEGLDVSPHLLEKLQHFTNLIPTHCADLLTPLPELKGKFDAVIGFFVLHHLPDQNKAFQAVSDLLKSGGKILFIEPNPYNPLFYLQILFHPKMRWKNERYILKMRRSFLSSAMKELIHFKMDRFGFPPPHSFKKNGLISS